VRLVEPEAIPLNTAENRYGQGRAGAFLAHVLAVKRSQGVRLGRPPALDPKVRAAIRRARGRGHTFRKIANDLNERGVATAHGGRCWYAATVRAALHASSCG